MLAPALPRVLHMLPLLSLLAACTTPPRPPTVDESRKRPANTALAVDLQVCRGALHDTRILADERAHEAEQQAASVARLARQQRMLVAHLQGLQGPDAVDGPPRRPADLAGSTAAGGADRARPAQAAEDARNTLYVLRFAFGDTRPALDDVQSQALLAQAREAPLVLLRGRTDGRHESPGESRVARERAQAVRDWLVRGGVPPARIRTTWQPVGDHAADNARAAGRAQNRRVEIELYRAAPHLAELAPPPSVHARAPSVATCAQQ